MIGIKTLAVLFAAAAHAAAVGPVRHRGGAPLRPTPQMAGAWAASIRTFFSSELPTLYTLQDALPSLGKVDLKDSRVRALLERHGVFQEVQAAAQRSMERVDKGLDGARFNERSALGVHLAVLNHPLLSDYLAEEQRPRVREVLKEYKDSIETWEAKRLKRTARWVEELWPIREDPGLSAGPAPAPAEADPRRELPDLWRLRPSAPEESSAARPAAKIVAEDTIAALWSRQAEPLAASLLSYIFSLPGDTKPSSEVLDGKVVPPPYVRKDFQRFAALARMRPALARGLVTRLLTAISEVRGHGTAKTAALLDWIAAKVADLAAYTGVSSSELDRLRGEVQARKEPLLGETLFRGAVGAHFLALTAVASRALLGFGWLNTIAILAASALLVALILLPAWSEFRMLQKVEKSIAEMQEKLPR